ncbi:MAG: Ig-like domain-containing protein, partial [Oscillospiraceae bacterium]|nr:Ig-like domain-containing protein [Oscillospiraceae bacterium]
MKKIITIASAAVITAALIIVFVFVFPAWNSSEEITPEPIVADHIFTKNTAADSTPAAAVLTPLSVNDIIAAHTPRSGYTLAPALFGPSGVDPASSFILKTPPEYDSAYPQISIDGQPPPIITREDENTFIVTPSLRLSSNSVYIFKINDDISWAFQTAAEFKITSTLPRNQSANVPVRTGVEISFSLDFAPDISKHFVIYPETKGKFISRGSTAVFVPDSPLEHSRVYTVTISAGVVSPDTDEVTGTDYIFSFETEPESSAHTFNPAVHFSRHYIEFPSFSPPSVSFWLNYDRNRTRPVINMNVYKLDDRQSAIAAVNRLAGAPNWSQIPQNDRFVDTSGLLDVHSSVYTGTPEDMWGSDTFTLPDTLPPGFYLLDAETGGSNNQIIIQITDLAVQLAADSDKTLLWVNDMTTGTPAAKAKIYDPFADKTYETTEYGIAVAERMPESNEYFIITAGDGKESVVFIHSAWLRPFNYGWGWGGNYADGGYWSALQLDRTLFQRSDTLSFWGFVQSRRAKEDIPHITVTLTEHTWWRHAEERDILHRENIPVSGGAYSGEIKLPQLEPGSYEIAVYHGEILLDSVYFNVMDYAKPPYQLNVSASKAAIFSGEEVTFTAVTEFFEGTPVPDLDISYNFWGWRLSAPNGGQSKTDAEGVLELSASPVAEQVTNDNWVQGESSLQFTAEATLPEIGWVHEWESVRVFINDINVRPSAVREGRNANLTVDVNNIILERINEGTAEHWGDYLGDGKAEQKISVEIFEVWWEKIPAGQRYDHITRQSVPWFRYEQRKRRLETFELTTDASGTAERDFTVPDTENRSYEAHLMTTDGNGRMIRHIIYIGRDYTDFYNTAGSEYPFLYGADHDGYDLGDTAELVVMRGEEPLTQGNFLFVVVSDGILSYHTGKNTLTFEFGEQHVPNTQVFAYHFNGHVYHTSGMMTSQLRYNSEKRSLDIEVYLNKETYAPGETAVITIRAKDAEGNPKAANVNIALVDEALFALMDYAPDTRAMLYRNVDDNLKISIATHRTFTSDGIIEEEGLGGGGNTARYAGAMMDMDMAEAEAAPAPAAADGGGGDSAKIRERFEDTAVFASVCTDESGEAEFTVRLPDNITSWRLTASALSDDLYAGNTIQNVRVTQPVFLHYTLNSIFLTGDIPQIGVNVYGSELSGGEPVSFEIWREDSPEDIRTGSGVSFERVNIPLWELTEEGAGSIIIRASAGGWSDAVKHTYNVTNSHRLVDTAVFYETITPETVFEVNPGGLTNITFTDSGRGRFLGELLNLCNIWHTGARIEGFLAKREASRLISEHFPDIELFGGQEGFNVMDYQTETGGIAILPYAEADLQVTVTLIPFIWEEVNLAALKGYLRNIYNSSDTDNKMLALYGLSMLGEPVLLELQKYTAAANNSLLDGLSVRNISYIALGFAAMGEVQTARELYNERILPSIQEIAPYYRVNTGTGRAEILDATAAAALLAAQLGTQESAGLHDYTAAHRFDSPHRFKDDALLLN